MSNQLEKVDISVYGYSIFQIETYGKCNMACQFCPYPLREDDESLLPFENVISLLEQINTQTESFQYVTFSQFNEPLLDKRIFQFLGKARELNIRTLLVTNALLLENKKISHSLIAEGPDKIKISLQTVNWKTFNKARGVNLSLKKYYNKIYQFLSLARKSEMPEIVVDLGCNFRSRSRLAMERAIGWTVGDPSVENDVQALIPNVELFLNGLYDYDSDFQLSVSDMSSALRKMDKHYTGTPGFQLSERISLKIKPFVYGRALSEFYPATHDFACHAQILSVLADGSVVPCCLMYDSSRFSLGNVKEHTLADILSDNSAFLSDLRVKNSKKAEICKKCFGQPTRRGVTLKHYTQKIRKLIDNPVHTQY